MSYTVVIPSKTASNVRACIRAIRAAGETCRIVIVDDLIQWSSDAQWTDLDDLGDVQEVPGIQPFIYARNANIGIRSPLRTDIILLNDDALLETQRGFAALASAAVTYPEYGLIAATTNSSGNPYMQRRPLNLCALRESTDRALAFVCVYIPRRTIDAVGLLDERFTAYGWEDTDYCRRVKRAGLKLGISDQCFVDHLTLPSTFRGPGGAAGDIEPGRRIYINKWGDDGL